MLSDADEPGPSRKVPHLLSQLELNDLVRDLGLTKEKSELLGSRLKEWNLLQHGVKCSYFRKRHEDLQDFFMEKEGICFCCNVDGLLQEMEYDHVPDEWRLFIDSSKTSLKAVLLHNGNEKPSIPLAHAVGLKETYQSMDKILCLIKYSEYKWNICGDLKVIVYFLGCKRGIQSTSAFCAFGTAEMMNIITIKKSGQKEVISLQGDTMLNTFLLSTLRKFTYLPCISNLACSRIL